MTNTKTVSLGCGKCSGSGRYHFSSGSDICYPCNGTGQIRMSAAKHAAIQAEAVRYEAHRAAELAHEERAAEALVDAESMIESRGIEGARAYFAAHRSDVDALAGLIDAMRNARLSDASNAVVRHRNALIAGGAR